VERITAHGLNMPKLGLGTWTLRGAACTEAVLGALGRGYRHIDTAKMYGNEDAIGAALAQASVPRSEIHLTTKIWPDSYAPAAMRRSLETSLLDLRTGYADLVLLHWPHPDMDLPKALEALMRLHEKGLARAIGVSNFNVALLRRAVEEVGAPIACNQVEYHVLLDQSKLLAYARTKDIAVTAYAPLARGKLGNNPSLRRIAEKHAASVEQVALKWLLDKEGVAAIPKAARAESQQANLDAENLTLDDADRADIAALPKTSRLVSPGWRIAWD
jgi:2,5-diketo-D-gluconate reductase B